MKMWIARDLDGSLWGYTAKPFKNTIRFDRAILDNGEISEVYAFDEDWFPSVTFENSPQQVEIKLIENGLPNNSPE